VVSAQRERAQIAEIQRVRLLAGAVSTVDELGYARATVAHITARARVSRRTFYELFASREECVAAVLEDVAEQLRVELEDLALADLAWPERVRAGLCCVLTFFDREPALARVCVVESLRGGPLVLERRRELVARLEAFVEEGGRAAATRGGDCSALTAECVVGGALAIVHARLLRTRPEPLVDLTGELVGMIVLPYLGAAAARREQARAAQATAAAADGRSAARSLARDPLEGIAMRMTYRTARVLEGVASRPGASNRELADHAGIADQGQVSKLLARLERLELLRNTSSGHAKGEPNAWTLTARGEQVAQSIHVHAGRDGPTTVAPAANRTSGKRARR
jgi:AcrR family transcriptional regulator